MLTDSFGRKISYLRLAVTDRCNLRCYYCMPAEGINWLQRNELMSYEEMLRTSTTLVKMGVNKIRITGGEPFVRKDLMPFLSTLSQIDGLKELAITTNGVLTAPYVPELKKIGIRSVNLSLDTLDPQRFFAITRRDEFDSVMQTLDELLRHDMDVKINAVVMDGKNIDDLIPLVALTKEMPVQVRFIEEMPFNGAGSHYAQLHWDQFRILEHIKTHFPSIEKIGDPQYSTSYNYWIPGHKGTIGIIAAYTRSFCGSCNRIRITPDGGFRTCLYEEAGINIKDIMRNGADEQALVYALQQAVTHKAKDGLEAESRRSANPVHESMTTIGG